MSISKYNINELTPPPELEYIGQEELARRLRVSDQTIRRWERDGRYGFPKAIRIPGARIKLFSMVKVRQWINEQQNRLQK